MMMPDPTPCEVKVGGRWLAVSLADAHGKYTLAVKRCPACHGPVTVTGNYTAVFSLTLMHRRTYVGCPLSKTYCGTPSIHPLALI
ncbi:hypothetical protein FV234_22295 [Methylobacterium sp. WL8]|nr:hypothetical protein FV234_22295 [Methylobacterium sp. WL8]